MSLFCLDRAWIGDPLCAKTIVGVTLNGRAPPDALLIFEFWMLLKYFMDFLPFFASFVHVLEFSDQGCPVCSLWFDPWREIN